MIIAFGNTKGGVGVSTTALLMAHYLAYSQNLPTSLIDLRENRTLETLAARSGLLEHRPEFEFFACDLLRLPPLINRLSANPAAMIVLDLPALLIDNQLLWLVGILDQLIIPYAYDQATLSASIYFAAFCRRINARLPILFVPSRIHPSAIYELRKEVDGVLRKMGAVSPAIFEHIGFQRISSLDIPPALSLRVLPIFELIFHQYLSSSPPKK